MRPCEIPLPLVDLLRAQVEDVAIQLVLLLLSQVAHVIVGQVVDGHGKRHPFFNVVQVLLRNLDAAQRVLRRKLHLLNPSAAVVKQHVEDLLIFPVHRAALQRLHLHALRPGILLARRLELLLLGGKALDQLRDADALGRNVPEFALLRKEPPANQRRQPQQAEHEYPQAADQRSSRHHSQIAPP